MLGSHAFLCSPNELCWSILSGYTPSLKSSHWKTAPLSFGIDRVASVPSLHAGKIAAGEGFFGARRLPRTNRSSHFQESLIVLTPAPCDPPASLTIRCLISVFF